MGMVFVARRLDLAEVTGVLDDPDVTWELLADESGAGEAAGRVVDLDKSWHGIHFLLTGSAWECDSPAGRAILGGEEVGEDMGYGPARLLSAPRVRAVASALADTSVEDLRRRYAADSLNALDIYPQIWDEADVFDEYLLPHFQALVKFYADAAAEGSSVLLALT